MDITASVETILSRKDVMADLFYQIFLDRYPDIRKFFVQVDLQQQAVMLTMALMVVEHHFTRSYPATEHYLKVLGHRHHEYGIPPEIYPGFCDCLLETLEQFHGNQWDVPLADQWREALTGATAAMLEGYQKPYIY